MDGVQILTKRIAELDKLIFEAQKQYDEADSIGQSALLVVQNLTLEKASLQEDLDALANIKLNKR